MPDGGVLNVEAVNYVLYNNRFPFLQHGNYVKIIIRDNGHGIAPENQPKVQEINNALVINDYLKAVFG